MLKVFHRLLRCCDCHDKAKAEEETPPDIAQLAEHLTVDIRSDQMVPGSIPGVRI